MPVPFQRKSSRAILLNSTGCVLLIRFAVPRNGETFVFWATPGGSVEGGETELDAARREVREELDVDVTLIGPVHTSASRFTHNNILVDNVDVFFVGRLDRAVPQLRGATEDERAAMQMVRWWSFAEIDQTSETIFPPDLSAVIRRFIV